MRLLKLSIAQLENMLSKYKISFHKGLQNYVLNELKEKYPLIDIVKIAKEYIEFRNDGICIEDFRNIYSTTLITLLHRRLRTKRP